MSDSMIVNEAKKWIDGLSNGTGVQGSWRLETIGKRYRYQKDANGVRHRVPVRIRRFAKGIPWSLVFEALKYLESQAPYTGIIFNGVRVDAKYRPTSTVWRRDDQELVDGNAQGSYTLVQDLIEDGVNDEASVVTGGTCSEEVVTDWVWDSASIEDLPVGGQGITYSIQSVRRNDDGTFDYALVKRTALTTEVVEHEEAKDSYEVLRTQMWDNVYGTLDRFTDHAGNVLNIPGATGSLSDELPERLTRRVHRNEDCTFRIEVERRIPLTDVVSDTASQKDRFSEETAVTVKAAGSPLPEAPGASAGRTYSVKSEKRPDGLYNTVSVVNQELEALDAVQETRATIHGTVTTTTHRNRGQKASSEGLSVGESVRNEQTKGGMWDQTIVKTSPRKRSGVRKECQKTVFLHTDRTTDVLTSKPADHVTRSKGETVSRQVTLTDSGAYEVTDTSSVELNYPDAIVEVRKTAKGQVTRRVSRNAKAKASAKGPVTVNEVTDGGLYNTTTVSVDAQDGSDRSLVERDKFSETREQTSIKVGSSASSSLNANKGGTGGVVYRVMQDLDDNGFITTTTRVTEELPVAEATVDVRRTNRSVETVTVSRGSPSPAAAPTEAGHASSSEVTPGGLYVTRVTSIEPSKGAIDRQSVAVDASSTTTEISTVQSRGFNLEAPAGVTSGVSVRRSVVYGDDGIPVYTDSTTVERPRALGSSSRTGKYVQEESSSDLQFGGSFASGPGSDLQFGDSFASGSNSDEGTIVERSVEHTPNGLSRVTRGTRKVLPFVWELPVMDSGYAYSRTTYFKNHTSIAARALISSLINQYTAQLTTWISQNRGPHSNSIDPQVSFNTEFGTVDGIVRCSASWLPEQAGTKGDLDKTFVEFSYSTTSLVSSYVDKAKGFTCYYLHKSWTHVEGRGITTFKSYMNRKPLYEANFNFNPRTITWAVDICTNLTVNTSMI